MDDKTRAERNPDGYAYRYHSQFGGTVLRFNHGEEVNGGRPFEVVPYWFSPPDSPRGDGWEALRELQSQSIHESAQEIRSRIDIMLAAAPKETPSSPKRDSSMLLHEQDAWFADTLPAWRCQACGAFHNSERCPNYEGISRPKPTESPAEPAQDDEDVVARWDAIGAFLVKHATGSIVAKVAADAVAKGAEIVSRLSRENADLRAFVAEWVDRFGFLSKRNKPDDICAIDEVACIITDDMDDLHAKLAAAEERIAAIVEWTHQYGANLCPFGNYTDSFGDGMRAAKEQVSRIAELGKGGA